MNTKSWMTISAVIGSFILASCQSTPQNTLIDKKAYPPPKVLIEPLPDTDNDSVPDDIDNCPNTPEGVEVDHYGCPVPVDLADTVTMSLRVFFERGNYELQAKFLPQVVMVAKKMDSDPELIVFLSGYTSSKREAIQASTMANKETDEIKTYDRLGQKRAQRIKRALLEQGISADLSKVFLRTKSIRLIVLIIYQLPQTIPKRARR